MVFVNLKFVYVTAVSTWFSDVGEVSGVHLQVVVLLPREVLAYYAVLVVGGRESPNTWF